MVFEADNGPSWAVLSYSGPFWAVSSALSGLLPIASGLEHLGSIGSPDRQAYQASGVLWKRPKNPAGALTRRLRCFRIARSPHRHARQASEVLGKRLEPRQAGLSDIFGDLGAQAKLFLKCPKTAAGLLIRHFAFPLGCSSGSFRSVPNLGAHT